MKAIIVLLAVAVAIIGSAAAWDSTNQLNYQYTKTVNTQAGENLPWFGPTGTTPTGQDAQSGASFSGIGAYGAENGAVSNQVLDIIATLQPVTYGKAAVLPDTHDVLTQSGSATVSTTSPDLQTDNVIKSGTASACENLALSGNYGGGEGKLVQALFDNNAAVGVDGVNVATAPEIQGLNPNQRFDYPISGDNDPAFSAQIEAEDAYIVDANLGSSASVGFEKIAAIGAIPTMSGGQAAWANFAGAYPVSQTGNIGDLETSIAGEQGFQMTSNFKTPTSIMT